MTVAVMVAVLGAAPILQGAPRAQSSRQGVRVAGTVVDAYAGVAPVPDVVTLSPQLGVAGFGSPLRKTDVLPDRSFVFDDVLPGEYQLSTTVGSELTIQVGVEAVTGLQLRHVGLTELFPSVRMDDGSAVPPRVGFHIEMEDGNVYAGWLNPERAIVLPPGRRFFFIQPPDGVFVRSMVSAGVDLFRERLAVEPVAPERGIEIVLTRLPVPRARVRGRVTGGTGPFSVQLTPSMFSFRKSLMSTSVAVAADGSFDVEVEPGIYDVHVPPAFRAVRGLVVPQIGATVEVPLPSGRLFGGGAVRVVDSRGQWLPYSIGRAIVLAARSAAGVSRFPVEVPGFWGVLPPGEYRLSLENLPAGVSVATLESAGRNLLDVPFVVPVERNPPRITLVLRYDGPIPAWVKEPPLRDLRSLLSPEGRD